MQKIVIKPAPPKEVVIDALQGNEIVAYRSRNSDNYCILGKLTVKADGPQKYGFIALNTSASSPRFAANTWYEAIKTAIASGRQVMIFTTMNEMLTAMLNKTF